MNSYYSQRDLTACARRMVAGLGAYQGWELVISKSGSDDRTTLRCYFARKLNPLRPASSQAREFVGLAL